MKTIKKRQQVIMGTLLLAAAFVLLSCSSPMRLASNWRNSTYKGPAYKKVMVIAMTGQATLRKPVEEELTQQLRSRGVEAVSFHKIIPDPEKASRDELAKAGEGMGIESYLVVRLMGSGADVQDYAPVRSFDRTAGWFYTNPGMTKWSEVAKMESLLYDGKTSELVWRATVDVVDPVGSEKQISQFAGLLVKTLSIDKMIP